MNVVWGDRTTSLAATGLRKKATAPSVTWGDHLGLLSAGSATNYGQGVIWGDDSGSKVFITIAEGRELTRFFGLSRCFG